MQCFPTFSFCPYAFPLGSSVYSCELAILNYSNVCVSMLPGCIPALLPAFLGQPLVPPWPWTGLLKMKWWHLSNNNHLSKKWFILSVTKVCTAQCNIHEDGWKRCMLKWKDDVYQLQMDANSDSHLFLQRAPFSLRECDRSASFVSTGVWYPSCQPAKQIPAQTNGTVRYPGWHWLQKHKSRSCASMKTLYFHRWKESGIYPMYELKRMS